MEKKCLFCQEMYLTHRSYSKTQKEKSKFCSLSCGSKWKHQNLGHLKKYQFKKGENLSEAHPNWKGEDTGIKAKHAWVKARLGKAIQCTRCQKNRDEATIDWANVDHKYTRNLKDYIQLCRSCHRQHDIKYNGYKTNFM